MAVATVRPKRPAAAPRILAGTAVLLLAAMLPVELPAQPADPSPDPGTLVGRVLDAGTGRPLSGAAVSIAPRPAGLVPGADDAESAFPGTDHTVLTGDDGRYSFTGLGEGRYLIRVTRLGYRPATLSVELPGGRSTDVSVGLSMKPVRLTPVSVSGDARNPYGRRRSAAPDEEVTARPAVAGLRQQRFLGSDVRAVTHDDVRAANTAGETDLFRALQRLPGVGTVDDWTALLQVRGGRWDGTRVYFDGLPLFNPLHVGTTLAAVNADAVGSLFFHPGVRPPKLGGGAASVVDLTSRRAGSEGTTGYGELSLLSARLALDRPLFGGRGGLMVAARRSYADLLVPAIAPEEDGGFPYALSDVTGRFDLETGDASSLTASVHWEQDRLYGDIGDVAQGSRAGWGNLAARTTYARPLFGLRSRHTLGISRYGLTLDSVPPDPELEERFNTADFEPTDTRLRHVVLRGTLEPRTRDAEGPRWAAGYEAVARSVRYDGPVPVLLPGLDARGRLAYRDDLYRGAAWAELRWRPLEPLAVRTGLRLEGGEAVENAGAVEVAPRIRARLRLSPDLTLSAGAGRHLQYVQSMAEGGGHPGSDVHPARGWRVAGDTTPAVRTDIVTVGGEFWLGSRWLASATAYHRRADGVLAPALAEGTVERLSLGAGRASGRGVELSLRRLAGRWTVSGSYSYGVTDVTVGGVTYRPRSDRRHLVDLTASWRPSPGVRIGAAYSAGSGAAYTRVIGRVRRNEEGEIVGRLHELGAPGELRGPGYSTLDLQTEFTAGFDAWSLTVYLQVRNALGRDNGRLYEGSRRCRPQWASLACRDLENGDVVDHFEMGVPTVPLLGFRVAF